MVKRKVFIFAVLFLLLSVTIAYADMIYLKNGRVFEGKVVEKTESSVLIGVNGGTVVFSLDEIEKIVPKEFKTSDVSQDKTLPVEPGEPGMTPAIVRGKPAITVDSIIYRARQTARRIHLRIVRFLSRIPTYYRWSHTATAREFRHKHTTVYYFVVYFALILSLYIAIRIGIGIIKWILGFFFPKLRL